MMTTLRTALFAVPLLPLLLACESTPELIATDDPSDRGLGGSGEGDDDDLEIENDGTGGKATEGPCDKDPDACEIEQPPEPACGDGRINVSGETCDDGNGESGDGCTANCQLEQDYLCPTPGEPCVSTVECGDAKITGDETCDDGNAVPGDGCNGMCDQEEGWTCAFPGVRCVAASCGDGIVAGFEECDFLSTVAGCTDCRIDDDYDCSDSGCALTECGNGTVERGEQCEDSNGRPFDGCYDCQSEPSCEDGVCTSVCGDGQRYADEECDDGNSRNGDGCSAECTEELGYDCSDIEGVPPESILLPVIYRDFIGRGHSLRDTDSCYNPRDGETWTVDKPVPCYHINFNQLSGTSLQGVTESTLGPDGTPDLLCPGGDCSANPGTATNNFTTNEDFEDWYDDDDEESFPVYKELTLLRGSGLTYNFDPPAIGFYPIDDAGWVTTGDELLRAGNDGGSCDSGLHNYSFSTETRFKFEYQGGERFDFNGDDDLWVFVNGQLAIDLGGLHGPRAGYFELDADTDGNGADAADGTATIDNPLISETVIDLGLSVGGIYEVALFHAERNYCGSNFEVTLKDFNKPKSMCESFCGDGEVASDELCDDGPGMNDGSYGHCGSDCLSRGPYCGDNIPSSENDEQCDDGVNLSTYGAGCAPGCVEPPSCGDGLVQSTFEDCDDGENDGGYGECAAGCVLGPRCGDGKVDKDAGETCDDKNRMNGDGCNVNCVVEVLVVR